MKNKFIENRQDNHVTPEQLSKLFAVLDTGCYSENLYSRIVQNPDYFYMPRVIETSRNDSQTTYTIQWDVQF